MKKIIASLFGLSLLIAHSSQAQKPKNFEGVITYAIELDSDDLDPMTKSFLEGMSTEVFIKGEKTKIIQDQGMAKTIIISEGKKAPVILMDMMGQKLRMKNDPDFTKKEEEAAKNTQIKETNETKTIAGYTCKKAEVTNMNGETAVVYYTPELPASNSPGAQFKGLKGMALEYELNQMGMKMIVKAKSVKSEKVADSKFAIPDGYTEVSVEDLQKMFGGGM
jgi:GLPGLI family protein